MIPEATLNLQNLHPRSRNDLVRHALLFASLPWRPACLERVNIQDSIRASPATTSPSPHESSWIDQQRVHSLSLNRAQGWQGLRKWCQSRRQQQDVRSNGQGQMPALSQVQLEPIGEHRIVGACSLLNKYGHISYLHGWVGEKRRESLLPQDVAGQSAHAVAFAALNATL